MLQQPDPLSRSLFYRVSDDEDPEIMDKPRLDRKSSLWLPAAPMSPHARTLELHHQRADESEDARVRQLAASGIREFRAVVDAAALSGKWTSRSEDGAGINVTPGVETSAISGTFSASSSSALPCSIDEIMHALSPGHMDHWNAAMIELFGGDFSYGVKVRSLTTESDQDAQSAVSEHLSLKIAHFRGSVPLLSTGSTVFFLDCVQRDRKGRSAIRVMQSLREDPNTGELLAGSTLTGYLLQEDRQREHSTMFVHATHRSGALPSGDQRRESTTHRLHRLAASLASKTGDLVLRRRLGAARGRLVTAERQGLADDASGRTVHSGSVEASVAIGPSLGIDIQKSKSAADGKDDLCGVCGTGFGALTLKKRHECSLCSRTACGACAASRDVEERIGLVFRARACVACLATLRHRAFLQSASSANAQQPSA